MNAKPHPILIEISRQLPGATQTLQCIETGGDFETIAAQAKKEIGSLEDLDVTREDASLSRSVLQQSGYGKWLEDCEDDDRLRVLGALKLIVELAEELAED